MEGSSISKTKSTDERAVINIPVTNFVLTPFTCASLVNEIFKGLLYQKNQIPYPYSWMKNLVIKKRQRPDNENIKHANMSVSNHFRIVSSTYDSIDKIMKGLTEEFTRRGAMIKEVIIVFGTVPQCPKEVISISISNLAQGHIERNHAIYLDNYLQKTLRHIFLSQDWMDSIDSSALCTNTFIYIKSSTSGSMCSDDAIFVPTRPVTFSPTSKYIRINVSADSEVITDCCENMLVYGQTKPLIIVDADNKVEREEDVSALMWYQCKEKVKGFRDLYINKVSASQLW